MVTAHAFAPGRVPATRVPVRLCIRDEQGIALLDKRLEVLGNRILTPGRPPPVPSTFLQMPLSYGNAYGGPGYEENPAGIGARPWPDGSRALPNVPLRRFSDVHPPVMNQVLRSSRAQ